MKDNFLSMITASCLSDKFDQIKDLMRDSVRIKTKLSTETSFQPWESKIGGVPSLPEGVEWPRVQGRTMSFIGQFNLSEMVRIMNVSHLPQEGMLYFFYDALRDTFINSKKDLQSWKVIYYNEDIKLLKPSLLPFDFEAIQLFNCCKVELSKEITLPQPDSVYFEVERYKNWIPRWEADFPGRIKLNDVELEAYEELLQYLDNLYDRDSNLTRMFGCPDDLEQQTQSLCPHMMNSRPVRPGLKYEKEVAEWELLFQIDSDKKAYMNWFDNGRLYFWIHSTALSERNFDNVCMILDCI